MLVAANHDSRVCNELFILENNVFVILVCDTRQDESEFCQRMFLGSS